MDILAPAFAARSGRALRSSLRRLSVGLLATVASLSYASDELALTPVQWQDQHQHSPQGLVGLGTDLFGDKVDLFTGGLQFVQSDVSLPGNDSLSVAVSRKYTVGRRELNRHFGDWDWKFPI